MKVRQPLTLVGAAVALALSGCSTMEPADDNELRNKLAMVESENTDLKASVSELEQSLRMNKDKMAMSDDGIAGGGGLLPANAKPGECYARVYTPPQYRTVTKTVLAKEASEIIEVDEPRFEWVEESVLVQEASSRLEVVPARYDWIEEEVLVREASEELVVTPAQYKTVQEQVLVRAAHSSWKKGRGPIERIDDTTGEIMCLIEEPAQYRTVTKQVLVAEATTQKIATPAEYNTVRKRVMVEPPKTVTVEIPAEYKTVRVRKQVSPATERRVTIPAQYTDVTDQELVTDGRLEWASILCETNTTPNVIRNVQRALRDAGYNPGQIDGVLGSDTMRAVSSYQSDNGIASGKLTLETLEKLGVHNSAG